MRFDGRRSRRYEVIKLIICVNDEGFECVRIEFYEMDGNDILSILYVELLEEGGCYDSVGVDEGVWIEKSCINDVYDDDVEMMIDRLIEVINCCVISYGFKICNDLCDCDLISIKVKLIF